jgi:23S rRNA (guanosine2251-2'-O)-methyltransferase
MNTELLYGFHPVREALSAGRRRVFKIYIDKDKRSGRLDQLVSLAETKGVQRKQIARGDFKSLTGTTDHQGAAAVVGPYPQAAVLDLLQADRLKGQRFLLMLDNVQDPQNLGAIVRTALCAGVQGVIVPKDRSASPTPAVSKASSGALEHIQLVRVTNLVQTIKICKNNGLWVIGLQKEAAQSIYAVDLSGSIAIVIGGEQKGIRHLVKQNCDLLASIPQLGTLNSLNASAAAAIAMYEALRQRNSERRMTNDE